MNVCSIKHDTAAANWLDWLDDWRLTDWLTD